MTDATPGPLTALSPLDGRYAASLEALRRLASEAGLIRFRVEVEVRWLLSLADHPGIPEVGPFDPDERAWLLALPGRVAGSGAGRVKEIEAETRHDVKAVEYWVKEQLAARPGLARAREFVHFGCTSEDVNNLAWARMLTEIRRELLLPRGDELLRELGALARATAGLPMLSRTHGQPASPTTLGKELAVFVLRLRRARRGIAAVPVLGKMNGAVGNWNAHRVAYPEVDWIGHCERFVRDLGLDWNPITTQIEPHDWMAELFHAVMRFDAVCLDLARDLWGYISLGYFRQKTAPGEVGSSTMPHKVNPIDFENAEGNLGVADALLGHLAAKLPVSRFQRDLSDSTALRNVGVGLGHALHAWGSILRGLRRLAVDEGVLRRDLDAAPEVLAEAIQTVLRRHGVEKPYELLRDLTRGRRLVLEDLRAFVRGLDLPEEAKERLLALRPETYVGAAEELVARFLREDPAALGEDPGTA